jgi:hypothetical protein
VSSSNLPWLSNGVTIATIEPRNMGPSSWKNVGMIRVGRQQLPGSGFFYVA